MESTRYVQGLIDDSAPLSTAMLKTVLGDLRKLEALEEHAAGRVELPPADGMAKNFQVLVHQWGTYVVELKHTVFPGVRNAKGAAEVGHKLHAIVEEFYDKNPRLASYLFYPLAGLLVAAVVL